jgi:hypothetical protein
MPGNRAHKPRELILAAHRSGYLQNYLKMGAAAWKSRSRLSVEGGELR